MPLKDLIRMKYMLYTGEAFNSLQVSHSKVQEDHEICGCFLHCCWISHCWKLKCWINVSGNLNFKLSFIGRFSTTLLHLLQSSKAIVQRWESWARSTSTAWYLIMKCFIFLNNYGCDFSGTTVSWWFKLIFHHAVIKLFRTAHKHRNMSINLAQGLTATKP